MWYCQQNDQQFAQHQPNLTLLTPKTDILFNKINHQDLADHPITFKIYTAIVSANTPRFAALSPLLVLRSGFFLRLQLWTGVSYWFSCVEVVIAGAAVSWSDSIDGSSSHTIYTTGSYRWVLLKVLLTSKTNPNKSSQPTPYRLRYMS